MTKAVLWIALLGALLGMGFCVRMVVDRNRFEAAIEAGDEARVRALLDAKPSLVDYRKTGKRGVVYYRPLTEAARAGHTRVVALLLDRGADINATSLYGTALEVGIDHPDVVALLLSRGAAVGTPDA